MTAPGSRPGQRGRYGVEVTQRETPTASGFVINIRSETTLLIIDPPYSSLLSGTVNLPAGAGDGNVVKMICTKSVVTLTVGALNGVTVVNNPGSIGWGGKLEWVYNAATRSWFCMSGYVGRLSAPPKVAQFTQSNIPISGQSALTLQDGPSAMQVIVPAIGQTQLNVLYMPIPTGVSAPYSIAMTYKSGDKEWGVGANGVGLILRNSTSGRLANWMSQQTGNAASNTGSAYTWASATALNASVQSINCDGMRGMRIDVTSTQWQFTTGDIDGFNWRPGGINAQAFSTYLTATGGVIDGIGMAFYPNNNWQSLQIETFAVMV